MSDSKLPVDREEFWKQRLYQAHATGRGLHTAIYDIDPNTWDRINMWTRGILGRLVKPGSNLLDAGCGYGALYDLIPPGVVYTGVDLSPDLVEIARLRHPEIADRLLVGDLANLPFNDREFHTVVVRSVRGMVLDNLGETAWDRIETELKRVGHTILLMEYGTETTQSTFRKIKGGR